MGGIQGDGGRRADSGKRRRFNDEIGGIKADIEEGLIVEREQDLKMRWEE